MVRDLSQWKNLTVLNNPELWNSTWSVVERFCNSHGTFMEQFWNGFAAVKQTIRVSENLKDKNFIQSVLFR